MVVGDEVADATAAAPGLPRDVASLLAGAGLDALRRAGAAAPRHALAGVAGSSRPSPGRPSSSPSASTTAITSPRPGARPPQHQLWFNKQSTCVVGPGAPIEVPRASEQVDYEGELGLVIGRRCRHVPAARASGGRGRVAGGQRRQRAGLAVPLPHLHDGQVVGHPWSARPVDGDRRRARRPPRPPHSHHRQRRPPPGRPHVRHGVRLLADDRAPLDRLHPRARRRHLHRHAGRGGAARQPPAWLRPGTRCGSTSRRSAPSRIR